MGRPPCCDKVGIKKGPWTPEEDIILVSYIQEHGPGNWRSVPTNTGLLRCSKSCRLRWTNYLRPGIKRGNFTPHEEGMIIHLQALLGNKWAAIASYLPQRTDNDIKNYWNTHLKKKLKKLESTVMETHHHHHHHNQQHITPSTTQQTTTFATNNNTQGTSYASSTENISRLLEGWMRTSPPNNTNEAIKIKKDNNGVVVEGSSSNSIHCYRPKEEQEGGSDDLIASEEFMSILSFENMNNNVSEDNNKQRSDQNNPNPPLSVLEKWLLDESSVAQVEDINHMMELSPIF